MPRYEFRAARREHEALEPLILTLSGEGPDGSPLPEFEEKFPLTMPAAAQLIIIEAQLDARERGEEDGQEPELTGQQGLELLAAIAGRDRLRKWMRAGYDTGKLGELVVVLLYFWNRGEFPNRQGAPAPAPDETAEETTTVPPRSRYARPSASGPTSSTSGHSSRPTSSVNTGSTSRPRSGRAV